MRRTRQGFTLIEMLVVISIILVMVTGSISMLSVFMRGQGLRQAGHLVAGQCMKARQLSTSEKVVIFMEFDAAKQVMRLWRDVDPDGAVTTQTYSRALEVGTDEMIGEEHPLPKNVQFDQTARTLFNGSAAGKWLAFYPDGTMVLGGGAVKKVFTPDSGARNADIILKQNGQSHQVFLDLSLGGGKIRNQAYRTE